DMNNFHKSKADENKSFLTEIRKFSETLENLKIKLSTPTRIKKKPKQKHHNTN
ncbi:hypothetical protein ACJX0J_020430, partial [Zea mays]